MCRKIAVTLLITTTMLLSGCQYIKGNKQITGAVAGAAAGAALGSRVGSGRSRVFTTIIGAIAGLYVGQKVGAELDEKDRIALQKKTSDALNKKSPTKTKWKSKTNDGVNASINTSEEKLESKKHKIVKLKNVSTAPEMTLIGKTYKSNNSANVRFGPSTDYEKSTSLAVGETFTAVGKTKNNWIMVAKNDITVGFVSASLVTEHNTNNKVLRDDSKSINLDNIALEAKKSGINLDNIELETEVVTAMTACKTMDIEIDDKGKKSSQDFKACKASDGAWEII